MIFKIIIIKKTFRSGIHQLLRITIRENIRKHSESSSTQESSWVWDSSKTKTVPVSHRVRTSFYAVPDGVEPGWNLEDETCVRQVSNNYVEMINCMIIFLVNF